MKSDDLQKRFAIERSKEKRRNKFAKTTEFAKNIFFAKITELARATVFTKITVPARTTVFSKVKVFTETKVEKTDIISEPTLGSTGSDRRSRRLWLMWRRRPCQSRRHGCRSTRTLRHVATVLLFLVLLHVPAEAEAYPLENIKTVVKVGYSGGCPPFQLWGI